MSTALLVNLHSLVRQYHLPKSKWLFPLFEAISNSIHAIEDASIQNKTINIYIQRYTDQKALTKNKKQRITGFTIVDNGIGFTDENFKSFRELGSELKIQRGGKGIGRLSWLKVFNSIQVSSIYKQDDEYFKLEFDFSIDNSVHNEEKNNLAKPQEIKTKISLTDLKINEYGQHYECESIADKIVEHFFIYFLMGKTCPRLVLHDEEETYDLNKRYEEILRSQSPIEDSFEINQEEFKIQYIEIDSKGQKEHKVFLLAHNRSVQEQDLSKLIPEFKKPITDDDKKYVYAVCISGSYLDSIVNTERTALNFPEEEQQQGRLEVGILKSQLLESIITNIKSNLSYILEDLLKEKEKTIREYIDKNPSHKWVLNHKEIIEEVNWEGSLTEEKLDAALYTVRSRESSKATEKIDSVLKKIINAGDYEKLPQYIEELDQNAKLITETSKSALAEYIIKRKAILKLLEISHELVKDEKRKELEKIVHSIIFPLKAISDEVSFDRQNLWIIDERLAFHNYLASDKKIKSIEVLDGVDSDERPDLLIFNKPFAFTQDHSNYDSIVIIEFKSPTVNSFSLDDNPIKQVTDYIVDIRKGKATDRYGNPIGPVGEIPIYVYIICNGLQSIEELRDKAYTYLNWTPDKLGFFGNQDHLKAYFEIISFRKIISDANKRNQIFFRKLGLS